MKEKGKIYFVPVYIRSLKYYEKIFSYLIDTYDVCYFLYTAIFVPLSKIKALRDIAKWFDYYFGRGSSLPGHSLSFCYASDYYLEVVNVRATKVAYSQCEFKEYLKRYLQHPEHERKERIELRRRFCYQVDGNSGKRFSDVVIATIVSKKL